MHPVCCNKDLAEAIFSSVSLSLWSLASKDQKVFVLFLSAVVE